MHEALNRIDFSKLKFYLCCVVWIKFDGILELESLGCYKLPFLLRAKKKKKSSECIHSTYLFHQIQIFEMIQMVTI